MRRISWIDQWRGLAVTLMVIYHTAFYLNLLSFTAVDLSQWWWKTVQLLSAGSFLFLVGVSLALSYTRVIQGIQTYQQYLQRQFRRMITIGGYALAITAITALAFPMCTIHFGILHLIAASIGIGAVLIPYPWVCVGGAVLIQMLSFYLKTLTTEQYWLLPLGLPPLGYCSFDYCPIAPWTGVVLLGSAAGSYLISTNFIQRVEGWIPSVQWLQRLGRNALVIYLVHPPVIFSCLWIVKRLVSFSGS